MSCISTIQIKKLCGITSRILMYKLMNELEERSRLIMNVIDYSIKFRKNSFVETEEGKKIISIRNEY